MLELESRGIKWPSNGRGKTRDYFLILLFDQWFFLTSFLIFHVIQWLTNIFLLSVCQHIFHLTVGVIAPCLLKHLMIFRLKSIPQHTHSHTNTKYYFILEFTYLTLVCSKSKKKAGLSAQLQHFAFI